ncbi:hypothetical protein [Desulfobulbus alkaliphilus]|uniref:hypothetical protein n=1 Tax=Desulfobulbus alkaliphilus TaxID=869814 RepID=UPI0019662FC9|nr:hypothetical protein [Desulfobulbus alkaliphilus]MBM9538830.1 hypothetical protein [Desulfobulbus alkaliphilus]
MEDGNIFDDDDALDCILLEEKNSAESKNTNNKAGCLSLIIVVSIPLASFVWLFNKCIS